MLLKHFTQNIDCLDREAGVPADKIIEAHGSFATQRCIECKTEYPNDDMKEAVAMKEVPHCVNDMCDGLVKPDIVFFGEALPESFFMNRGLPASCDLAIVMGTSLTVQPFASLPSLVGEGTPRVLINMERVGGLGSRPDDVCILDDCDKGVRQLADALGWRDELEEMWRATQPDEQDEPEKPADAPKDKQSELEDRIAELTAGVDKTLKLSGDHTEQFKKDFASRKDTGELPVPGATNNGLTKHADKEIDHEK
ncbi:Sir2 histone deacetylase Hst2, partial [Elasticomyces elasticus]